VVKIGGRDPSAPLPHQQAVDDLIRPQRRHYGCPGIERAQRGDNRFWSYGLRLFLR
jgi:hypothetical protein